MIKRINKIPVAAIVLSTLLISSCRDNVIYTEYVTIPGNTWNLTNVPSFSFPIADTLASANILFSIRTGSDYPFRNIYFFVSVTSPDGKTIGDTLEYFLADEKGKWHGKGFGDIKELSMPFKSNVYFPVRGRYTITVQHGMRVVDLPGVYDLGLRIEKVAGQITDRGKK